MTTAKGYGFNAEECLAGVQAIRENTCYNKNGVWAIPRRMYYTQVVYDTDANGHQLYDAEGKKQIKSKKWVPFTPGVPLQTEVLTGASIGNRQAYYVGLQSGSTVNLSPLNFLSTAGYDTTDVMNMTGSVKFTFHRSADTSSTIRDVAFGFSLHYSDWSMVTYESGKVYENQYFSFTVAKSKLASMFMAWGSASKTPINNGWQVPIDWSYTMTFIP